MPQTLKIIVVSTLAFSCVRGAAFAQATDCAALKNSMIPYQITYDQGPANPALIAQVYRDQKGYEVTYFASLNSNREVMGSLQKELSYNGAALEVTTYPLLNMMNPAAGFQLTPAATIKFKYSIDLTKRDLYADQAYDMEEFDNGIKATVIHWRRHFVGKDSFNAGPCIFETIKVHSVGTIDYLTAGPNDWPVSREQELQFAIAIRTIATFSGRSIKSDNSTVGAFSRTARTLDASFVPLQK